MCYFSCKYNVNSNVRDVLYVLQVLWLFVVETKICIMQNNIPKLNLKVFTLRKGTASRCTDVFYVLFIHFNLKKMRKNDFWKMFNGSPERLIIIVSEQNNFYKKIIKLNEHLIHFVKSFAATLFLYAIRGLNFIRFHWYFVILLHIYSYL